MRVTEKMLHKVADPLSKILFERGYRNFGQVQQAFYDWLETDDTDIMNMTSGEIAVCFINYLKEYKYE